MNNNEQTFKTWLGDSCGNYPSFLKTENLETVIKQVTGHNTIYEIDNVGDIENILNKYLLKFRKENKKKHNGPSAALNKYKEWLLERGCSSPNPTQSQECPSGIDENGLELSLNKIVYGAPGTGKSWSVNDKIKKVNGILYRTTFHPDTDYSTFVGCYKPHMNENGKNIEYKFIPQVFLKTYIEAWNKYLEWSNKSESIDTDKSPKQVFLVIEEINRGNCAQIFGDIFQLLDRKTGDFVGFSEYAIYPDEDIADYLKKAKEYNEEDVNAILTKVYNEDRIDIGKDFYLALPPNLHIWATMNTSDQSLFPMDSAFKRRWDWEYCPINLNHSKANGLNLDFCSHSYSEVLEKINLRIKTLLKSADKQMGEFFVKSKDGKKIVFEDFRDKVIFYLFNDVFKDNKKFAEEFFGKDYPTCLLFEDLLAQTVDEQEDTVKKWLSGYFDNIKDEQ
jgi:5-methylcytosine-specific restriction endonuclease McrBC GTP-binding regulatory subunit McrB